MSTPATRLEGLLGDALHANLRGRLSHFIVDENSPAIALFAPAKRDDNRAGDWYGEHAGKWLYAAAKAASRSGDATLRAQVQQVADYLVSVQELDGYLGTYAADHRFMQAQPAKPVSWDGAPSVRTWDIWTHAYLVLGLLETYKHYPEVRYLDAACHIGDLCLKTLTDGGIDITELGNHFGLSATVLMDPAVELYLVTGERCYLDLARRILAQLNDHPDNALLTRALAGTDAAHIATGKAYQLSWNLVGLAKLYRATGENDYRQAVDHLWHSIREHHLTLGGGPWGGVAHRSREVFNAPGVFSPYGYVETCSTLAWIQLNRELLSITGEARYAEEIERSAYNDLLAAQAPNGEDWCYYVYPNGKRVHTTYWRCCKSSGSMALEELPTIAYTQSDRGALNVNLYGPGETRFSSASGRSVLLQQQTRYPFDGDIALHVRTDDAVEFTLRLRIPSWATDASLHINGVPVAIALIPGEYAVVDREWRDGDTVTLHLPMQPTLHRAINRNIQESKAPDGSDVRQEVLHFEYVAITCGPLVFATGLIDGFKVEESIRLPEGDPAQWLHLLAAQPDQPPHIRLELGYRPPVDFVPYFCAGGRNDGAWRLTWLSLAPATD
ncbi:glycoside hydrolase family 127 protein [Dyella sp. 20L07]|uniref:glycoside hydrolase family 127 protein n=1 Tax=Dyella sp. 20L07 TaxID=3384240 RepID=UPI003D2ACC1F